MHRFHSRQGSKNFLMAFQVMILAPQGGSIATSIGSDTVEGHGFINHDDEWEAADDAWEVKRRSQDLTWTYVSGMPDAGQLSLGSAMCTVLASEELESYLPGLVIPAHFMNNVTFVVGSHSRTLPANHELVFQYARGKSAYPVIERVNSRDEALTEADKCRAAMVKWKDMKTGKTGRDIKARLVAQGFKDQQRTDNFAGATSRWGQRWVVIFSAQFGWQLVSADVSEAFRRGLTFRELFRKGAVQKCGPNNFCFLQAQMSF